MYIGKQQQCQTEVVDFLEHKIKKNKKEDYILIDGDFEPIISEDLFNKVQEIKKQRTIKNFDDNKAKGLRTTNDKWLTKLECNCGSKFQKYNWRVNASTGEQVVGYTCRHRVVGGSVTQRIKQGIPLDDVCSMPSIPSWKFDFMALRIFSELWQSKTDCIMDTYSFLERYYKIDSFDELNRAEQLKKQITRFELKIRGLTELYTEEEISLDEFRSKKKEYKEKLETLRAEYEEASKESISVDEQIAHNLKGIKNSLNEIIDFSGEQIDEKIVANYVDRVVIRSATEFEWYINIHGDTTQFINEKDDRKFNESYASRARKTIALRDSYYHPLLNLCINFDEARAFKKKFGKYLRGNQWSDITITVYIR